MTTAMDEERLEMLGRVATWYYEDNLDQTVIAERLGKSRSLVSRLLQEAREAGLVEIRVTYPLKRQPHLESELVTRFGLREAWVLADPPLNDHATLMRRLGRLGARAVQQHLQEQQTIGVGWGAALHELVQFMPRLALQGMRVVQILGSAGHRDPMRDGSELARWLAQKLQAEVRLLPAPLYVENETIVQSLRQDPAIAETLAIADQADIALIGIGGIDTRISGLYRTGYFDEVTMRTYKQAGAVGDIIGRLVNAAGELIDLPINHCVIGQDLVALGNVPLVIAIAGELIKASAIHAALRRGVLDILVTDAAAAQAVLSEVE